MQGTSPRVELLFVPANTHTQSFCSQFLLLLPEFRFHLYTGMNAGLQGRELTGETGES